MVHPGHSILFFGSIFWCSHTDDHPYKDVPKFSHKSKKITFQKHPSGEFILFFQKFGDKKTH
jgi:hypothetical protein